MVNQTEFDEPFEDGDTSVPAYWELGQGKGSVPQAEAYRAAMNI
jgi:hypothetical protein